MKINAISKYTRIVIISILAQGCGGAPKKNISKNLQIESPKPVVKSLKNLQLSSKDRLALQNTINSDADTLFPTKFTDPAEQAIEDVKQKNQLLFKAWSMDPGANVVYSTDAELPELITTDKELLKTTSDMIKKAYKSKVPLNLTCNVPSNIKKAQRWINKMKDTEYSSDVAYKLLFGFDKELGENEYEYNEPQKTYEKQAPFCSKTQQEILKWAVGRLQFGYRISH